MIGKERYFSTITLPNWYWEVITKLISEVDESEIKKKLHEINTSFSIDDFRIIQNDMNKNFNRKGVE